MTILLTAVICLSVGFTLGIVAKPDPNYLNRSSDA